MVLLLLYCDSDQPWSSNTEGKDDLSGCQAHSNSCCCAIITTSCSNPKYPKSFLSHANNERKPTEKHEKPMRDAWPTGWTALMEMTAQESSGVLRLSVFSHVLSHVTWWKYMKMINIFLFLSVLSLLSSGVQFSSSRTSAANVTNHPAHSPVDSVLLQICPQKKG